MKIINLLPQSEQQAVAQQRVYNSFKKFIIASGVVYVLLIAGLFGWKRYLESTLADVDMDIKKNQSLIDRQDNDEIRKQVQKDNSTVNDYLAFSANNPRWSKVMVEFSKLVPSEVLITSLSANTKTGKIDITGVGLTRDAILTLRANVAGSSFFKNINLPLENLQKPTNAVFSYTFYLADGALKK